MDANRFDRLSRTLAHRLNRRQAVQALAAGGLATVALTQRQAGAQSTGSCQIDLVASVRLGPNSTGNLSSQIPGELRGQLRFDPESLSDATFILEDGTELAASGQATGQAITLRLAIPLGGTLVLIGAAERSIRSCEGPVDGLLTGPAPGDLGDWHGMLAGSGETEAQSQPTSVFGTSSSSSSNPSPTPAASAPTPTPTPTPAATTIPLPACGGLGDGCDGDPNYCCPGFLCQGGGECLAAEGQGCSGDFDCFNGSCHEGVCQPKPALCSPVGQSCAANACCTPGYCSTDAVCQCDPPGQFCTDGVFCCSGTCGADEYCA